MEFGGYCRFFLYNKILKLFTWLYGKLLLPKIKKMADPVKKIEDSIV